MSDLGIIPELELDCLPLPGDLCVSWVDSSDNTAGLSEEFGSPVTQVVAWSAILYRSGQRRISRGDEPEYISIEENGSPRKPMPGDIVRIKQDDP